MKRNFSIEYREWHDDGIPYIHHYFEIQQNIYQKLTIRDVKEHVKEQMYKMHEPVCSCFLEIWHIIIMMEKINNGKNAIIIMIQHY